MSEERIKASDFIDPSLIKALQDIDKEMKVLVGNITAVMSANKTSNEEIKKGVTSQKDLEKNLKLVNKSTSETIALEKELERLRKDAEKSTAKIQSLKSKEYQESVKARENLKKEKEAIDSTYAAENKRRANIGKYKEDIIKAYAIIGVAITAAVGIFKTMASAIKENEVVSEFLERKVGGLSAAYGVLKGKIFGALEGLVKSDSGSITWGKGLRSVLSFISMGFSDFSTGIAKLSKEMDGASATADKYILKLQDLENLERSMLVPRALANQQLAEARDKYNDVNTSIEDKLRYLNESIALENKTTENEVIHQKEVIKNIELINSLKKSSNVLNDADLLRLEQAKVLMLNLQEQKTLNLKKAKSNLRALEAEASKETTANFEKDQKFMSQWMDDVEKQAEVQEKYNEEITKNKEETQAAIEAADLRTTKKKIALLELEKRAAEEVRNLQIDSMNAIFNLGNEIGNNQIARLEFERDKDVKEAGDNAKKKEKIEEAYTKKINAIKLKQAIADKALAILNITISTKMANAKIMAQFPLPAVYGPIVGWNRLFAALQIAAVLAAPLPKFFKGVKDFKGGPAVVGEKGYELGETKEGKMFLTPDKATAMALPKGTNIYTHEETVKMMGGLQPSDLTGLIKEQKLTRKALANQIHRSTNITADGWMETTRKANSTTKHIDKYFRT